MVDLTTHIANVIARNARLVSLDTAMEEANMTLHVREEDGLISVHDTFRGVWANVSVDTGLSDDLFCIAVGDVVHEGLTVTEVVDFCKVLRIHARRKAA